MDTTKVFILMCKMAEELQELWEPAVGDWCVCNCGEIGILDDFEQQICKYRDGTTASAYTGNKLDGSLWSSRTPIWLPRQDQLQGMSGMHWIEFDRQCATLANKDKWVMWRITENQEYIDTQKPDNTYSITKEKAGLMVVMKEKFNKRWDGENWK